MLFLIGFSAFPCDVCHSFSAINRQIPLFCGTDHCRHSPFHFEVENNSLQTFNPCR
ncbi:hypothetical protein CKO_03592 [Citrobacter koseri ATCC BAA-895]|uniref:Uncharacterized protein n=1 Tax=Citrobacter koseri (strain ATCC BAA-895 / CDC 4225-83 / SGSC4696) TaxID=290338 RepID=A8AMF8_CITK8|nr:hypothetical protein CKO_03592 [Citrobacter koseri ATCC BAA-895]